MNRSGRATRQRRGRAFAIAIAAAAIAVPFTALSGLTAASATRAPAVAKATGACGSTVPVGPSNPNGPYASLPASLKGIYSVYPGALTVSPWANFKGVKGPWRLGYIDFAIGTPYDAHVLSELQTLYAAGVKQGLLKGTLTTSIPPTQALSTPESQINAIEQMVREGVNAIILSPVAGASEAAAIDAAGKAGVPVLLADNIISQSKYAISVWSQNQYQDDAATLKIIGKGNVLAVRGIAGNENETLLYNQFAADMKDCPNVHIIGTVYGNWNASTAKTVVSQYLASHPAKLAGVLQDGGMMPGIIEAFQAAGQTVPPVADGECEGADLSWWLSHVKSGYSGAGGCYNGFQGGYTYFNAALRVLAGKGPKYNVLEIPAPLVTNANIATYATPNEPLSWDGEMRGATTAWCDNTCLNQYFNKPGAVGNF
jgi:ribose transport system substrate-binding protein